MHHFQRLVCCLLCCTFLLGFATPHVRAEEAASVHHYASVLLEAESGSVLSGTDADTPLPIGSLAKLMTIYLTAEAVAAGTLTPEAQVAAPPSAQETAGAVIWLTSGEKMTVTDLLKGIIIGNANDAAITLACQISGSTARFVSEMNAAAFSLGMRNTRFTDCTGLDDSNRSTAHDIALLCRALLAYDWLTPIFTTWRDFLRDGKTELVSENTLTRTYDGILGFKAGHGDASGYTLALAAQRGEMRCIAVVLGCDDEFERFTYGKNLLANGFANFHVTTPDFSAEFLRPVTVQHGMESAVELEVGALCSIAAPEGASLSCAVVLPAYVEAPVRAGQQLGVAAFYCDDCLLYEVPLSAAEAVPRRHFLDALRLLVEHLF